MKWVKASAPGKIILGGEHSVVYGYPAIAAVIDRRLTVKARKGKMGKGLTGLIKYGLDLMLEDGEKVEVKINSQLPINRGLGSSAALATALVWAVRPELGQKEKDNWVKKIEDFQHNQSSGVDQTVVREGGFLKYQKVGGRAGFKKVDLKISEAVLIDSGKPKESTGEMVVKVSKGKFESEFKEMGKIVDHWEVKLISANQRLLEKIGVVGEKAKKIVREVEKIGGQAKVCGAGGVKAGSGTILAYHSDREKLLGLIKARGYISWLVKLGGEGARYEEN